MAENTFNIGLSEEARQEKTDRLEKLKRLQLLKAQQAADSSGTTLIGLAQSFNKGVVDLINLPSELINLPLGAMGAPTIPTEGFRQQVADVGLTAQPGEEETGFLNRSAEILGASVIPAAAIQVKGAQVLKAGIPAAQRTVTQHLTATTAQSPRASAALDIASSGGAGIGGEVASNLTDEPNLITLGEIAGGFTFPAVAAVSRFVGKPAISKIQETIVPFTKAGAEPRAARRLQSLSSDPVGEARIIDPQSPVSPARQTGNPRLIALEKVVLDLNPELEAKFTKELNGALEASRVRAAEFGGADRTREVLKNGQEHLVELVNLRAATAAQSAQARINAIEGGATPRDISRIARGELDNALKDVRTEETRLWDAIDSKAPATFNNTRAAVQGIDAEEGTFVPSEVPLWVRKATSLKNERPVTLNDIKQVRSRLLSDARSATNNNEFNKARILNRVADGLLVDMGAVKDEGVSSALAFSRQLNQRFKQGAVGDILNRGANRGAGIESADTLKKITSGATPATNIKQFIAASPESAPQIEAFIKSSFVKASSKGGKFDLKQSQVQMDKLESQGVFEIFPNLKGELGGARLAFQDADKLAQRAATVSQRGGSRLEQGSNKSLAGILLGAEPGQEMAILLRAEKPEAMAAALKRRMGTDERAIKGLKTSFVETMFNEASKTGATGEIEVSGKSLAKLLNENLGVAKALGMNDAEINRMRVITRQLIQSQKGSGESIGAIIEDQPAEALALVAQIAGAKAGQRIAGGGLGSSMVLAGKGSGIATRMLQKLTTDKAQQLLIAAQSDPVLYKALLTKSTAKTKDIFDATRVIESWLIGSGVEEVSGDIERNRLRQGSENVGVTEQLNLGAQ